MDVVAELERARVEGEPMALASTTTSSGGGGPGSGRRGVLAATKAAQMNAVAVGAPRRRQRSPPTGALPVRATSYGEPTREAHR